MSTASIGIFDSGVGGITVLRALQALLPNEDIVYFADTARLPYGAKSAEQIVSYSRQILAWMQHEHRVKLVVVACNTSSALAIEAVSGEFTIPVIDTIKPLVSMMTKKMPGRRVLVIATHATARSQAFENAFHLAGYSGVVKAMACPQFVPLIETGQANSPLALKACQEYLGDIAQQRIDTVVYGCTHYPLMESTLRKVLPQHVSLLDPATCIAHDAYNYLKKHELLHSRSAAGQVHYYTSSEPNYFSAQLNTLFAIPHAPVAKHTFD